MLEFTQPHRYKNGDGIQAALDTLESGKAFKKFESICKAQGDFKVPPTSRFRRDIVSKISGVVFEIDNRKITKVARLAGAPNSASAGVYFLSPIGKKSKREIFYTQFILIPKEN